MPRKDLGQIFEKCKKNVTWGHSEIRKYVKIWLFRKLVLHGDDRTLFGRMALVEPCFLSIFCPLYVTNWILSEWKCDTNTSHIYKDVDILRLKISDYFLIEPVENEKFASLPSQNNVLLRMNILNFWILGRKS